MKEALRQRLARLLGISVMGFGIILCGLYLVEAVLRRIGDPDQSLLFWYLPLLMFGVICLRIGRWLWQRGRVRR